jgi:hypothetical protein
MRMRWGTLGPWFVLWVACSSDEMRASHPSAMHPADASRPEPVADSGKPPVAPSQPPATRTPTPADAGAFTGVATQDETQPLQARVQVNGANTPCGACAVVIAQAQGGKQPYSYAWSDPSLTGPGPHQVCPDQPTEYSVVVTDSSEVQAAEFGRSAQTAEAAGKVECTAPSLDAGGPADFVGCQGMVAQTDAGPGGQPVTCETGDGGYYSGTGMLPMPILGGHTYTLNYDQLIPIVVGEAVVVDIYGSNTPCALEEKLTSWTLDGTWHHPGCFTPTKNYDYVLIRVYVGFTLFYFDLLQTATFCAGCSEEPQL